MKRLFRLCILTGLLPLLAVGCQGNFQSKWAEAGKKNMAIHQASHPLAGPWQGKWLSSYNNHSGELRCLVSPVAGSPNQLNFHFHARWGGIFAAAFQLPSPVKQVAPGKWEIQGGKDLGEQWGGKFTHTATATPEAVHSRYRALGDHGTFELRRLTTP